MQVADDIVAVGAQIIWVMEYRGFNEAGTAANCYQYFSGKGATTGICVGDSETSPGNYPFFNAVFAAGRGVDLIVDRGTMEIVFTSAHGSPGGNDNLTGAQVLAEVQTAVANASANISPCD